MAVATDTTPSLDPLSLDPLSLDPPSLDPPSLDPLVRDLVAWIAARPRAYGDVLDAWRTSCPRLTVWEDACERGFVTRRFVPGDGASVHVTEAGRRFLATQRA